MNTAEIHQEDEQTLLVEQNVLGAIMQDNSALDRLEFLRAEMFSLTQHRETFTLMQRMVQRGEPVDAMTLSSHGGDMAYLARIQFNTVGASNVIHYANMVKQQAQRREIIRTCGEIMQQAHSDEPLQAIIDQAQERILGLSEKHYSGPAHVRDVLAKSIDALDARFHNPGSLTGLSTGFADLDNLTSGMQEADLIIIAGRPSMGKTTFAMNIAEHVSETAPVLVFSLEMPAEKLINRMVCSVGPVNFGRYRSGQVEDDEWPKVTNAVSKLADQKLHIDDDGGLTISQIRSRARKAKRQHGVGLVVIDYLQLIQYGGKSEGRRLEVEAIVRSLKEMAKELKCPVLVLSQLSRAVEQRANKRPLMSDLRETGAIEQDADVIAFVYRDEVYNRDTPDVGLAEILVEKQRDGEIGMIKMNFQGHYCRFTDYTVKW